VLILRKRAGWDRPGIFG